MQISSVVLKKGYGSFNCWRWISFTNKYSLIATINHSGTLNNCHIGPLLRTYTHLLGTLAVTKLAFNVGESSLNNTRSCILFYSKVEMFPRIYQKFPCFFSKGVLSCQTLGVMTPDITPALKGNWVCPLSFQALQPCSP